MAKMFDEDNVHDFWGLSPSIDVHDLLNISPTAIYQPSEGVSQADTVHVLQVTT